MNSWAQGYTANDQSEIETKKTRGSWRAPATAVDSENDCIARISIPYFITNTHFRISDNEVAQVVNGRPKLDNSGVS